MGIPRRVARDPFWNSFTIFTQSSAVALSRGALPPPLNTLPARKYTLQDETDRYTSTTSDLVFTFSSWYTQCRQRWTSKMLIIEALPRSVSYPPKIQHFEEQSEQHSFQTPNVQKFQELPIHQSSKNALFYRIYFSNTKWKRFSRMTNPLKIPYFSKFNTYWSVFFKSPTSIVFKCQMEKKISRMANSSIL